MSTHNTTRHATGQSQHCEQPYDGADCHCGSGSSKTLVAGAPRVALAGAPNAGKTSIYNALTGLHAKTGNYPGVTVQRSMGTCKVGGKTLTIEDLPGAYSLDPISPDEQVVRDVLTDASQSITVPDALVVVVDATTLRRGLNFVAEALSAVCLTAAADAVVDDTWLAVAIAAVVLVGVAALLGVWSPRPIGSRNEAAVAARTA